MIPIATSLTRREPLGLGRVQRRRKLALLIVALLIGLALPFVRSFDGTQGLWHETIEILGMVLISAGIVGRSWCALYIGGRKAREIVATGPYSISRNPLYLFSLVAVLGIGFQTGSLIVGCITAGIAFAIFLPVIMKEEAALTQRFGQEFDSYRSRVPRFGPKLDAWKNTKTIVVHPKRLGRTFAEALLFLLAIPLCEAIDKLQDAGYFAALIHLF
jgi:protein-S-isoprenylcysteine O-methyltransferase Ste14